MNNKIVLTILLIISYIMINLLLYIKFKKNFIIIFISLKFFLFIITSVIVYIQHISNKKSYGFLTDDYELITTSNDSINTASYWIPKEKIINDVLYKPLGCVDNYDIENKPLKKSIIVPDSKTTKPTDYIQVFKNETQKLFVWKPIPENNYVCLGDVITNTQDKPSTDLIRCVPSEWVKQNTNKSDVSIYNTKIGSIWIGSYENSKYANLLKTSDTSSNNLLPIHELVIE